jgi:ATP-dependent Clp protease ATP-binding subunit ClpA
VNRIETLQNLIRKICLKFTEGAIKVIMLSQEEARRMGHNFVGTEQLLLGVIGQRHGIEREL